jgi:protein-S-isoprenylcysteine O-methyltransferase Ste14
VPYLELLAAWLAWCFLHSLLITPVVRRWLRRRLGPHDRGFRLLYNTVAVLTLLPVVLYGRTLHGPELWRWDGPWVALRVAIALLVLWLARAGARKYDLRHFLGLTQLATGADHATLSTSGKLDTTGVLGITRHPWYLAGLMFVWIDEGVVDTPALIENTLLSLYLVVDTVLEERKLVREFGDDYRAYQRRVPMLVPWRWWRR